MQHAAVVGRTFWEGSLAPLAELATSASSSGRWSRSRRRTSSPPGAESRLAGERELAFKHVLIRDVAYGMLPKAVRARKHFEVGSFIEERAGDRTDEVVSLLAEHYGRAAALGREGGLPMDELDPMQRRAMLLPRAGRRRRRAPVLQPRGGGALPPRARDLPAGRARRTACGSARSRATSSLRLGRVDEAIEVWLECLE